MAEEPTRGAETPCQGRFGSRPLWELQGPTPALHTGAGTEAGATERSVWSAPASHVARKRSFCRLFKGRFSQGQGSLVSQMRSHSPWRSEKPGSVELAWRPLQASAGVDTGGCKPGPLEASRAVWGEPTDAPPAPVVVSVCPSPAGLRPPSESDLGQLGVSVSL